MVLVDFAEGVFQLGEGLVEDGGEDAVLLVGEERGEGVGVSPKKRSMRRMTSGRLARRMAVPTSAVKVSKASTSSGSWGL